MDFKLIECPKCKIKHIVEYMVCGHPCSCGLYLNEDTEDNRKEVKKDNAEFAGCFNTTFEEFQKWLKVIEKDWNEKNAFVHFKVVSIPNEKLIELVG